MKSKLVMGGLLVVGWVFLTGCAAPSGTQIAPTPHETTTKVDSGSEVGRAKTRADVIKDVLGGKDLDLPYKYKADTSFKDLTMLVQFTKIETKRFAGGRLTAGSAIVGTTDRALSTYLQAKIAKSKRFDVYCVFGNGAIALAKELGDLGEADISNLAAARPPKFDVFCDAELVLSRREFERCDGTDRVTYQVDILVTLKSAEKRMLGEPMEFRGKTSELKIIKNTAGERIGGVNLEEETQAIRDAALDALRKLYYEVGNQFPVSGEITGISMLDENRMQFNRGTEQGLQKSQQLTIWYNDGGTDIPLAYAEADPGENSSSIKILAWAAPKGKEAAFDRLRKQIISPGWIKLEGNKLYCTSNGLAAPPEWRRE